MGLLWWGGCAHMGESHRIETTRRAPAILDKHLPARQPGRRWRSGMVAVGTFGERLRLSVATRVVRPRRCELSVRPAPSVSGGWRLQRGGLGFRYRKMPGPSPEALASQQSKRAEIVGVAAESLGVGTATAGVHSLLLIQDGLA